MAQITYTGTAGNDLLDASALTAKDTAVMTAGAGQDTLIGSTGADRLTTDGDDFLSGGAGNDDFYVTLNDTLAAGAQAVIDGGTGTDRIAFTMTTAQASRAAVLAELSRLNDFLNITLRQDPTAHFVSSVLHLDMTGVEIALGRVGGGTSTVQQIVDGPTAVADAYAATEDTTLVVTAAKGLLANDGLGAGTLAAVAETRATATGGTVRIATDGSFTYLGGANANGTDSFTYTAIDSIGQTDTATVTVAVAAVNDAPTAVLLSAATVAENAAGAVIGTLSVTEVDVGDSASYLVTDDRFEVVGTTLKLKAGVALDYETTPSTTVMVIATDSGGLTKAQAFSIAVTNVNEAPTAPTLSSATVAENAVGAVIGTLSATDPDAGDGVTFSVSDARFAIDGTTLKLAAGVALDFEATPVLNLAVTATDQGGLTTTQVVTIAVTDVDEAPVLTSGTTASQAENATGTVYTVAATNQDAGTTLTYALSGADAALFAIDSATGSVHFKAAPDFEAPADTGADNTYDVTVTASNGRLSASQAVAISVTDVNEAPVITTAGQATVAENTTGTVYATAASDPDAGTVLAYSLGGPDAALFAIDSGTGAVSFKAAPNYEAPAGAKADNTYDVTVTASDGLLSATQAVTITVTNVNEAPGIGAPATTSVAENATGTVFTATGSDPDANTLLAFSLSGPDAAAFAINAQTGAVSFKDAPDFETPADAGHDNTYDLTVTASDGALAATQAVAITVTNVNEAPTAITLSAATVAENAPGAVIGTLSTNDPDAGETITYSVSDARFAIDGTTLKLAAGVALDFEATPALNLTVTATDHAGLATTAALTPRWWPARHGRWR